MRWLLDPFYLYPALFALLGLSAIWRVIRSFDVSAGTLRVSLVVLATLLLAPMVVPAGAISTVAVPNALLLIHFDLSYYIQLAKYTLPSFGATALLSTIAAFVWIRKRPARLEVSWATFAFPAFVVAVVFGAYQYAYPDTSIPPEINTAAVEQAFGAKLDDVIALHDIADPEEQRQKVQDLKAEFSSDPAVIYVSLENPGHERGDSGPAFHFNQGDRRPRHKTCVGVVGPEQKGLRRCYWTGNRAGRRNVIRYRRQFDYGGEHRYLVVEFDLRALLRALPES